MIKLIHTSDIHIRTEGDERWEALLEILEETERQKADYLVISGDLFHKDANADIALQKLRPHFEKRKFKTILIPGNHDANSYSDGTYLAETTSILTKKPYQIVEEEDVRFIGLPYDDIASEDLLRIIHQANEQLDNKKTNIFLFHGDLADIQHVGDDMGEDEQDKRYMPARLAYFRGTYADYVLAGHYHTNFIIKEFGEGKYFVYPGSPVSTTRKEIHKRKVNLLTIGNPPQAQEINTFYYYPITIILNADNPDPSQAVENALKDAPKDAKIILNVGGFIPLDEKIFDEKLQKLCKQYEVVHSTNETRNLEYITGTDLYRSFEEKLRKIDVDDHVKESAMNYLFEALVKVTRS